ncbi:MAG: hypothetical protein V4482_00900 [Pseudomonadota bacterium]
MNVSGLKKITLASFFALATVFILSGCNDTANVTPNVDSVPDVKKSLGCMDYKDAASCAGKKQGNYPCKFYPEFKNSCLVDTSGDCGNYKNITSCSSSKDPNNLQCLWLTDIPSDGGKPGTGCRAEGYLNGQSHPSS